MSIPFQRERQIGTLRTPDGERAYPIMFWRDYGVVMPAFATTNGHCGYTAQLIAGWLTHGYVLESDELTATDPRELFEQLKASYRRYMYEVTSEERVEAARQSVPLGLCGG